MLLNLAISTCHPTQFGWKNKKPISRCGPFKAINLICCINSRQFFLLENVHINKIVFITNISMISFYGKNKTRKKLVYFICRYELYLTGLIFILLIKRLLTIIKTYCKTSQDSSCIKMSKRSHHVPCSNYNWDNICLFVCKHYSAFCRSSYFFSFELSLGGYGSPVVLFFTHWRQVIFVIFCRFPDFQNWMYSFGNWTQHFQQDTYKSSVYFAATPVSSPFLESKVLISWKRDKITLVLNFQIVKVTSLICSTKKCLAVHILKIFFLY
jgi:hypothetical protein